MRPFFRAAAPIFFLVVGALAWAQQPDRPSASPSPSGHAAQANDDDALLARVGKLYYSSKSAGLTGFDCAVHPDWLKLIQSSETQSSVAGNNESLQLLRSVAINLHARMNGGSVVEWVQPSIASKPLDQNSAEMLDQMHKAVEETLMGFMQFWTPFVDGSIVPPNSKGIEIRHSPSGIILKNFRIVTGGKLIDLTPSYDSGDDGLLVSRFVARIGPAKISATDVQEMDVEIYYQTVGGFPIPSRLNVDVVGTGTFNLKLDGCRVNPAN
jgi:hypothetical protein